MHAGKAKTSDGPAIAAIIFGIIRKNRNTRA
jgi:hypothetical protein